MRIGFPLFPRKIDSSWLNFWWLFIFEIFFPRLQGGRSLPPPLPSPVRLIFYIFCSSRRGIYRSLFPFCLFLMLLSFPFLSSSYPLSISFDFPLKSVRFGELNYFVVPLQKWPEFNVTSSNSFYSSFYMFNFFFFILTEHVSCSFAWNNSC